MSQMDAGPPQSDYYDYYQYEEGDEYRSNFFSSLWPAVHQNKNEMNSIDCNSTREKYSKYDAVNEGSSVAVCDTVFHMAMKVIFSFCRAFSKRSILTGQDQSYCTRLLWREATI